MILIVFRVLLHAVQSKAFVKMFIPKPLIIEWLLFIYSYHKGICGNYDKISCIYLRTSPLLDLVSCIWKSTKNMLNDLNSYIIFIHSCITFFFLFIYWWFTSVRDRFRAITTMEAKVAVFWIKKHIYELSGLDVVAHTQNILLLLFYNVLFNELLC